MSRVFFLKPEWYRLIIMQARVFEIIRLRKIVCLSCAPFELLKPERSGLSTEPVNWHIQIHNNWHIFSSLSSDWLPAKPPANQKPRWETPSIILIWCSVLCSENMKLMKKIVDRPFPNCAKNYPFSIVWRPHQYRLVRGVMQKRGTGIMASYSSIAIVLVAPVNLTNVGWSVASCKSEALVLWRHIRRLPLYWSHQLVLVFTSESQLGI